MKRSDVETHSYLPYGGPPMLPALNVKVRGYVTEQIMAQVREEVGDEGYTLEWFEEHSGDWAFEAACQSNWEMLEADAQEVFDRWNVSIESAGRSGGWCVVRGLPDLDEWDAVLLGKWARFAKYARSLVDDVPYQMAWIVGANTYEQWKADRHKHSFVVTVECDTAEQAEQVMAERIGPDEDYGFEYTIDWKVQ